MILTDAIKMIQSLHLDKIVMIEFEDGSGHKFNYKLSSEDKKRFINLKDKIVTNGFVQQYEEVAKIMNKW